MKSSTIAIILVAVASPATAQDGGSVSPVPEPSSDASAEGAIESGPPPIESAPPVQTVTAPPPDEPIPEPAKKGAYSSKVHGKLWLEGSIGPTVYDPDVFTDYITYTGVLPPALASVDLPKQKGTEFGGAIGGALLHSILFIGGTYRQANYEAYKLMKAGVLIQGTLRTRFVHPVIRGSFGFAKTFGGDLFPVQGLGIASLRNYGFFGTFGVGFRIPIVRWVSVLAAFEWSGIFLYLTGEDLIGHLEIWGHQYGGNFALTFHFVGVYDE